MSPDQFVEVTRQNVFSRFGSALKGFIFAPILFSAAILLFSWNENRDDKSQLAASARIIEPSQIIDVADGELVSITGDVSASEPLGDDYLQPGDYVAISRTAEIYAWVEESSSTSKEKVGGTKETTTTYTYTKAWTDRPQSSDQFKDPVGHTNPRQTLTSHYKRADTTVIGVYNVDPSLQLPTNTKLTLTTENAIVPANMALASGYLYKNVSSATGSNIGPAIGDERITYRVLPADTLVSAFGTLRGSTITTALNPSLGIIMAGSREQAIESLHQQHLMMLWGLRVLSFVLIMGAIGAITGPLHVLASILPPLAWVTRSISGIFNFIFAGISIAITYVLSLIIPSAITVLIIQWIITIAGFIALILQGRKILKSKSESELTNKPLVTVGQAENS